MQKMTRAIGNAAIVAALLFAVTSPARADQYVHGYSRSDGTYVQPYWRSDPDGNPYNNYSFPGNLNPYTGTVAPGDPDTYLQNYYGNDGGYTGGSGFGSWLGDDGDDE